MSNTIQYTVTLNDLMSGKLRTIESNIDRLEKKLGSLGKSGDFGKNLTTSSIAAGVAFGAAAFEGLKKGAELIAGTIKDIIHTETEYQKNMLRISNLSKDGFSEINKDFVIAEALKYKLPIEEVMEGYGRFLGFTRNSDISNTRGNKLQDDILLVSKVMGIKQDELSPVIKDVGKMLSAGVLETKVLRNLENTGLGAITPFLAKEIGKTPQEMSQLMSGGKLTKLGISSDVLLTAFDKFANSLKGKLDSTLKTYESFFTDVHNFKILLYHSIGETGGFQDFMSKLEELFSGVSGFQDQLTDLGSQFFEWMGDVVDRFKDFAINGGLDELIESLKMLGSVVSNVVSIFIHIAEMLKTIFGGFFTNYEHLQYARAEAIKQGKSTKEIMSISQEDADKLWEKRSSELDAFKRFKLTEKAQGGNLLNSSNHELGLAWTAWGQDVFGSGKFGDHEQDYLKDLSNKFTAEQLMELSKNIEKLAAYQEKEKDKFAKLDRDKTKDQKKSNSPEIGDSSASKVHGPKNTNVYITINGGFGNFDITNTSSDGNFLSGSNRQKIRDEIIELLEESVNDGIAKAGK